MVEDMIQQSMKSGDFSKLTGMGKPLKDDNFNPYVDEMQHKLNKILINNGFSPPSIMNECEIRDDLKTLRFVWTSHTLRDVSSRSVHPDQRYSKANI